MDEHYYLDFDDGRCADVPDDEAVPRLVDVIADVTPDTVLSFGPKGATGHSDHISTCRWTTEAVRRSGPQPRLLYATTTKRWNKQFFTGFDPATIFMIDGFEPELLDEADLAVWFSCDQSHLPRKVAAMRAQASQIEPLVQAMGVPDVRPPRPRGVLPVTDTRRRRDYRADADSRPHRASAGLTSRRVMSGQSWARGQP